MLIEFDFEKKPKKFQEVPGKVKWITTKQELEDFITIFHSCEYLVFDLETTGLDEYAVSGGTSNGGVAARVSMLSATMRLPGDKHEPITYLVPLSHPKSPFLGKWKTVLKIIAREITLARPRVVGHNVKFDARWIKAMTGISIAKYIYWDTQIAAHLLDENSPTALKEVVPRLFKVERWDDHDLSYPGASEDVDYWELGTYAARDTYWTHKLLDHQIWVMFVNTDTEPWGSEEIELARLGMLATRVSMPTVRSLTLIEERGMILDKEWAEDYLKKVEEEADQRLAELIEMYRMDFEGASTAANSKWFIELTNRAIEQGELEIIALTPTGNPKWGKDELGKLSRKGSKTAERILEYRQNTKQAEYLRSWMEKVTPKGTIHANYNAGRVATGRLSSNEPNMQQVTSKLRPAFLPRPGNVIIDLDYSQLELRIAAFLSRSKPMIEAYQRGDDLHRILAAEINGVPLEEVDGDMRQGAKAANFGLLYGQQPEGFRTYAEAVYGVLLTEEESVEMYNHFFDTWEGMREWHESVKEKLSRTEKAISPVGRIRRLPEVKWGSYFEKLSAERKALNAPVQGFGADLMNISAARISGVLEGYGGLAKASPIGSVHDSLMVECPLSDWEEVAEQCSEIMRNPHPVLQELGVDFDVPLEVEYEVGTRWGLNDVASG